MTKIELTYSDLKLTDKAIYEVMGIEQPTDDVRQEMNRILAEIQVMLHPKVCYSVFRGQLDLEDHSITIDGKKMNAGKIVTRQLRGSEAYAMFVCSAGMEFQEYQERLMREGDMVRVFIADAIGSCIAECCADRMEEYLQRSIDKLGWHRTNRFSPGYCGWHVREQQILFPLMSEGPEFCGVKLTESSLMIPIKSVSGIIGLGPEVTYLPYTCGLCNFEKCYKRRKKETAK